MKILMQYRFLFLALIIFLPLGIQKVNAQNGDKEKVRLKVNYIKIMNGASYIDVAASAKVDNQNINVSNIDLAVYNEFEDEKVKLGEITIPDNRPGRYYINSINDIKADSSNIYTVSVYFKGNDVYQKASKSVSFKNADINAEIITEDSLNFVTATLTDNKTQLPIAYEPLTVQVKRLFKPLKIGGDFNNTDENGAINVAIDNDIPALDGKLTIEVVLNDSETYGTIKTSLDAPIGIPIVEESTFDKRTMWSPPAKTPIFLLILCSLLILGVWIPILILINNLIRIYKSKN